MVSNVEIRDKGGCGVWRFGGATDDQAQQASKRNGFAFCGDDGFGRMSRTDIGFAGVTTI